MSNLNTQEDKATVKPAGPTKYRYRYVFTLVKRHDKRLILSEVCEAFRKSKAMIDQCNSVSNVDSVDVRLEIWDKPNKRWLPVNT